MCGMTAGQLPKAAGATRMRSRARKVTAIPSEEAPEANRCAVRCHSCMSYCPVLEINAVQCASCRAWML